jgi:hypothetical protein
MHTNAPHATAPVNVPRAIAGSLYRQLVREGFTRDQVRALAGELRVLAEAEAPRAPSAK